MNIKELVSRLEDARESGSGWMGRGKRAFGRMRTMTDADLQKLIAIQSELNALESLGKVLPVAMEKHFMPREIELVKERSRITEPLMGRRRDG